MKTQNVKTPKQPVETDWDEFFEFMRSVEIPEGWMEDRPMNTISPDRDPPLFSEDD
jgi:hypothetical protein